MAPRNPDGPMRIKLSEEGRTRLAAATQRLFDQEFDHELSDFQAERLIDFFVRRLGAAVYNQAIQDARGFIQTKLDDLDGEFYEPEDLP